MSLIKFGPGDQFDWGQPDRIVQKWWLPIDQYLLRPSLIKSGQLFQKLFTPQEISVVQGEHEEKEDSHGFAVRHLLRIYPISREQDKRDFSFNLFIDGFLTLVVPKTQSKKEDERPSASTGPSQRPGASTSKDKSGEKKEKDGKNA